MVFGERFADFQSDPAGEFPGSFDAGLLGTAEMGDFLGKRSGGPVAASGLGVCHAGGDVVGFDEGKRAGEIAWGPAFG